MDLFSTRTPERYLLMFQSGPLVLYEYFATPLHTIDLIKPSNGLSFISALGNLRVACDFAGLADPIAAVNIRVRGWALVNAPNVSTLANQAPPSQPACASGHGPVGTSPRLLAVGS